MYIYKIIVFIFIKFVNIRNDKRIILKVLDNIEERM